MNRRDLDIEGACLLEPERHFDERGFLSEVYRRDALVELGIDDEFVQENHILSSRIHTIRGLHFQINPHPTAKLVRVVRGAIFDVVLDLRHHSPTFGEHVGIEVSADNWLQVYVPTGCAHGFCTLEPNTEVTYKVSDHWFPEFDRGVYWNDPDLGISWPASLNDVVVSEKDRIQPRISELPDYFVLDEK